MATVLVALGWVLIFDARNPELAPIAPTATQAAPWYRGWIESDERSYIVASVDDSVQRIFVAVSAATSDYAETDPADYQGEDGGIVSCALRSWTPLDSAWEYSAVVCRNADGTVNPTVSQLFAGATVKPVLGLSNCEGCPQLAVTVQDHAFQSVDEVSSIAPVRYPMMRVGDGDVINTCYLAVCLAESRQATTNVENIAIEGEAARILEIAASSLP